MSILESKPTPLDSYTYYYKRVIRLFYNAMDDSVKRVKLFYHSRVDLVTLSLVAQTTQPDSFTTLSGEYCLVCGFLLVAYTSASNEETII